MLAGVALALGFVPYKTTRTRTTTPRHDHYHLGWSIVMGAILLLAAVASVYLVYVLEIFKFKSLRTIQLRAVDPETTEHEIVASVERDIETGEFDAVKSGRDRRVRLRSSATVGERGLTRVERALFAVVLALTALAGVGRYVSGIPHVVAFILAALALAGLAWTVSFSTEQIGMRYGPAVTGTLQSTVGNLPEFFVVIFALQAHDTTVAETALIGSILVNALLVLGMVLIAGARQAPDGADALQPTPAERHRHAAARLVADDRAGRRRDLLS